MTQPDKPFGRRNPPSKLADYEVGYAKPSLSTRFRRGQSGNPSGRRKGSIKKGAALPALNDERLKTIILEEAYRSIGINDPSGQIDIPMAQAVARSLAVSAAKGNQRAQRLFIELRTSVERDNKKLHDEWLQTAIHYKVEWDEELARRKKFSVEAPPPLPHPADKRTDDQGSPASRSRCQRITVSDRTIASAPYILGNNRQTPPNISLPIQMKGGLPRRVRRSTLICCRKIKISASSANSRPQQVDHHSKDHTNPTSSSSSARFSINRQQDWIYGRDRKPGRAWVRVA